MFDVCTLIWVCALQFWVKTVYMLFTFSWLIIQISLAMITFCSNVSTGKGEGHWSYYRFVYPFRVFALCSWRVWVLVHIHLESCLLMNQSLHFHIISFYMPSKFWFSLIFSILLTLAWYMFCLTFISIFIHVQRCAFVCHYTYIYESHRTIRRNQLSFIWVPNSKLCSSA